MKIPKQYYQTSELYKKEAIKFYEDYAYARNFSCGEPILPCPYDFSGQALLAMYEYETFGKGNLEIDCFQKTVNGYAIGQKWLNVEIGRKREILDEIVKVFNIQKPSIAYSNLLRTLNESIKEYKENLLKIEIKEIEL